MCCVWIVEGSCHESLKARVRCPLKISNRLYSTLKPTVHWIHKTRIKKLIDWHKNRNQLSMNLSMTVDLFGCTLYNSANFLRLSRPHHNYIGIYQSTAKWLLVGDRKSKTHQNWKLKFDFAAIEIFSIRMLFLFSCRIATVECFFWTVTIELSVKRFPGFLP